MNALKSLFKKQPGHFSPWLKFVLSVIIIGSFVGHGALFFVHRKDQEKLKPTSSTKSVRIMIGASFNGSRIVITQHNYVHADFDVLADPSLEFYPIFRFCIDVKAPLEILDIENIQEGRPVFVVPPEVYSNYTIIMIEKTESGLNFFEGDYARY